MKFTVTVGIATLSLASLTACGGAGQSHAANGDPASTPTAAAASAMSSASSAAPQGSDGSNSMGAGSQTASSLSTNAPLGRDPRENSAPGVAAPAPVGDFKYQMTTGGDTKDATATVQTLSRSGDDVTQRVTIKSGDGSVEAQGVWSPRGSTVTESSLSGKGMTFSCSWKPAVQQFEFPMKRGMHWTSSTACDTTAFGQPTHVTQDIKVTVTGTRTATVDGQSVGVWILDRRVVMKVTSASFTFTSDTRSTEWYDPPLDQSIRTVARSHSTATYAGKTQSGDSTTTTVLLSLRPS